MKSSKGKVCSFPSSSGGPCLSSSHKHHVPKLLPQPVGSAPDLCLCLQGPPSMQPGRGNPCPGNAALTAELPVLVPHHLQPSSKGHRPFCPPPPTAPPRGFCRLTPGFSFRAWPLQIARSVKTVSLVWFPFTPKDWLLASSMNAVDGSQPRYLSSGQIPGPAFTWEEKLKLSAPAISKCLGSPEHHCDTCLTCSFSFDVTTIADNEVEAQRA